MITIGRIGRAGAALAAGGLIVGLSAIPAGSQSLEPITITGTASCVTTEEGTAWAVDYTIHNDLEIDLQQVNGAAADLDVQIEGAVLSGAAEGNPDFDPNPVPAGGDAFASGFVDATASGVLTLTVEWAVPDFEDSGSTVYDLTLDGPCAAPVTTPDGPAVQAVDVTPAFTG